MSSHNNLHQPSTPNPSSTLLSRRRNTTTTTTADIHPTMHGFALDLEPIQQGYRQRINAQSLDSAGPLGPESLASQEPSLSIAIPGRRSAHERPTTPLSGRPATISAFDSALSEDLRLRKYPSSTASQTSSEKSESPERHEPSAGGRYPLSEATDPRRYLAQPSTYSHRPSPLSPGGTLLPSSGESRQPPRRREQKLAVPGLPRFHPANFHHGDLHLQRPPQKGRPATSAPRVDPRSGPAPHAQLRLQQYQREVLDSLKKGALSPQSPRLGPQGSPGGPITPLALEAQGDYFSAASGFSPSGAVNAREFVDKMIQRENETRANPEAGSRSGSPALSPAVSPAGGPG